MAETTLLDTDGPRAYLEERIPTSTAFTCFPQLPKELQFRVWKYASNEPCRIIISKKTGSNLYYERKIQRGDYRIPAVFHTSSDARMVGVRECSPIFSEGHIPSRGGITASLLSTIAQVPLFAKLRYMELEGPEFSGPGYSNQLTKVVLNAIPGLEKLTLHGLRGAIGEYYSDVGKREDENMLQFWTRKRGSWDLLPPSWVKVNNPIGGGNFTSVLEEYKHGLQSLIQAVDDGLFCDTACMPASFRSQQNAAIQKLRGKDTRGWCLSLQLAGRSTDKSRTSVTLKSSGIMFSKGGERQVWHGFTELRKKKCIIQAELVSQNESKKQNEVGRGLNEASNT